MAGILDNQFMKLILSGSPYMQARENQRRQDELAGRMAGLIGTPGTMGSDDGMGVNLPGQMDTMGTGLLGGQMTQPQFAARAMAIPGYEGYGAQMMGNINSNQAAMARQKQDQQWGQDNMTAYQKAQMGIQNMQAGLQSKLAGSGLMKDMMGMAKDVREGIYSVNKGPRKTIQMTNQLMKRLPGFENGYIDWDSAIKDPTIAHQAVTTLAKSILGEEAVNVDDRGAITATGATGTLAKWISYVNNGTMGKDQLKQIVEATASNAQQQAQLAEQQAQDFAYNPAFQMGRPQPIQRLELPRGNQGAINNMPSDVMPVGRQRNYAGRRR